MAAKKPKRQYDFVPKELWGKFPIGWVLMLDGSTRIAFELTMLILAFLIHYAGFFAPSKYTGDWVLFLTAGFGPAAFAAWYMKFPFNPYRSMAAAREGMKDMDQSDAAAKRLVVLLRSPGARNFLWRRALQLSLLLLVPMMIVSAAIQKMPIWRFGPDVFIGVPMFFFVCLFVLFRIEVLAWALKAYKDNEKGLGLSVEKSAM